jgi:hypothetical protein
MTTYIQLPFQSASGGGGVIYSSATIITATTSATGSTWVTLPSQACNALDLVNNTGTAIEYRRGGAGNSIPLPDRSSRLIVAITNTNQIQIRRVDQSNSTVTITGEAITQ